MKPWALDHAPVDNLAWALDTLEQKKKLRRY
jgi:hypothetical protein